MCLAQGHNVNHDEGGGCNGDDVEAEHEDIQLGVLFALVMFEQAPNIP